MWQEVFEKHGGESFTVVGIALDVEGIPPAKLYYDKFETTFPALVDANYATGFGAVPKTFFIDEHGVVLETKDWEQQLARMGEVRPVTDEIRAQWTTRGRRLSSAAIAELEAGINSEPQDLAFATELASRYLALGQAEKARGVLDVAVADRDARAVARGGGDDARLLGQAFLQLARAAAEPQQRVRYATLSFYLDPSVGFGKQIARLISPEKFDGRPRGDFDNRFREATLSRLKRERAAWLEEE